MAKIALFRIYFVCFVCISSSVFVICSAPNTLLSVRCGDNGGDSGDGGDAGMTMMMRWAGQVSLSLAGEFSI